MIDYEINSFVQGKEFEPQFTIMTMIGNLCLIILKRAIRRVYRLMQQQDGLVILTISYIINIHYLNKISP
jgi:hypothetical protein